MALNTLAQRLKINGLIDTNQNVVSNMEKIARNATTWLSYDTANGKWAVVINKAGTSVKSFDDSNIVGPISVTGKDVTELYNKARVSYPLRDSADKTDTVVLEIPVGERSSYEKERIMDITYDMVNEPVQAQLLGLIELKQSRINTIVEFTADYSTINVASGDIIDLTSTHLGYDQKLFRVISLEEGEANNGAIIIKYQCLEYDDSIYDETALTRYIRTDRTNIKSIGVISQPTTPVISVVNVDSAPRHQVEMVVPNGIVNGMELWVSFDNTNWEQNHIFNGDIENDGDNQLTPGNSIVLKRPYLTIARTIAGAPVGVDTTYTVYWKYRGFNAKNKGPFSSVGSASWTPILSAEGTFLGATLIKDDGTKTNIETGEFAGVSEAQLGNDSATAYATATGYTIPTKDTGAPAETTLDFLEIAPFSVSALNTSLASVCGTATLSAGYVPTTPGNTVYATMTHTQNYDGNAIQSVFSMPFGEYDYQYYDAATSGNSIFTNVTGYVPTRVGVQFKPFGSSTFYPLEQTITNVGTPTATINITSDEVLAATAGSEQTNNLKGEYFFSFSVHPNTAPTSVGRNTASNVIYPYNWDLTLGSTYGLELQLFMITYQF